MRHSLKRVTTTTLQFQPTAARSRRMVFRVSLAAHARSNSTRATKRCRFSHPSLGEGHATPRVTAASAEDDTQTGASCTRPATVVRRCSHERRRDAGKLALRHGQSGWMDGWEVRNGIKESRRRRLLLPCSKPAQVSDLKEQRPALDSPVRLPSSNWPYDLGDV